MVTAFARSPGSRKTTAVTSASSFTRSVFAASQPSLVYASRISCSGGPSVGICRTWSVTLIRSTQGLLGAPRVDLDQILDRVVAVAKIAGTPEYRQPILDAALAGLVGCDG
ncbi:hypothetical protein [Actinacidiphila reveromycinica]|uniref:hypothetical protein n=1 Tax=Actinacidiphila reveromycinica TaxID=659352 RepID=UPI001F1D1D55|nr:hypothetical protein [Streptomyces sp. SN-593]